MKKHSKRFDRLVVWPLCVLALLTLVYFYFKGFELSLTAPLSLGEEGQALFASHMLALNENPYNGSFLSQAPWRVIANPPLYFAILGWLLKISGAAVLPMRMVSAVSFVILIVAAHKVFALSGASRVARVLGLLNLCSFWTIWAYSFKGTPDMLSMAFMVLAIEQYMVLARKPKDDNLFRFPRLIVIASLAVMASLTRASCAAVVPAIALALIVGRQWRLSLLFMLLTSIMATASLLFLNNVTAGGFTQHVAFADSAPFSLFTLNDHLGWLSSDWLILAAAPIFMTNMVLGYFKGYEERQGPYRHRLSALVVMLTMFSLSSLVSFYVMGKAASTVSDFFLVNFAVAWMVAFSADFVDRKYLSILFLAFGCGFYVIFSLQTSQFKQVGQMERGLEEIRQLQFDKRSMLSEDCSLALVVDAQPEFVDIGTIFAVWQRSPNDFQARLNEIKTKIKEKSYGSIVINSNDGCLNKPYKYWDESVIKLIKENYRSKVEIPIDGRPQDLYLPK